MRDLAVSSTSVSLTYDHEEGGAKLDQPAELRMLVCSKTLVVQG